MARGEETLTRRPARATRSVPAVETARAPRAEEAEPERVPLNREQVKIARWLKRLKFRKTLFGGVREQEVWKRMGELNALYEAALVAERARCDALIEEARAQAFGRGR